MLSILIPIYNVDVRKLVAELDKQAQSLAIQFEIICIDDHSSRNKIENREILNWTNCRLIELQENIGRSRIRNRLADLAQYDYLLFLDCDLAIEKSDFLQKYLDLAPESDLVSGGLTYPPRPQNQELYLHWLYGTKREVKASTQTDHFLTCNFLIKKSLFQEIRFNEQILGYGHEDTLFGIEIMRRKIVRKQADSPVCHLGLNTATEFLTKTEIGIQNLCKLIQSGILSEEDSRSIRLVQIHLKILKLNSTGWIARIFDLCRPRLEKNLTGKHPSLFLLDFYKLGLICKIRNS